MTSEKVSCLADSATTHTVLRERIYFTNFVPKNAPLTTLSGPSNLIEGYGKARIMLSNGTILTIVEALYSPRSGRTLLSFKDIRDNNYHAEIHVESGVEFMCVTSYEYGQKRILEKMERNPSGLYTTTIRPIECHYVAGPTTGTAHEITLWHDRLGHPGRIVMRRIFKTSHGHPLTRSLGSIREIACQTCSMGKLITKPSYDKIRSNPPIFLQRIQGDICGPIQPPCGPFRYFMVLVDASTCWSHVCLLSTRNAAFSKLLAQVIKLRAHHPDYPIKSIRLDNAGKFTSKTFDDYCMSVGVEVEHPLPYVHTQNGLAEAFIKRLQMIARSLVIRTKLPIVAWGHAILHAAKLVHLRPVATQPFSALQLVTGCELDISHLRVFGCTVYVPISPPLRTKMGSQRRMGIYVGYDSPSIIRYLEPLIDDLFTARFVDCHFYETVFPPLGGDKNVNIPNERRELLWTTPTLSHLDPRTAQSEAEVQRILDLQSIAQSMPDAFTDLARVTRSHIPAANTLAKIDVPNLRRTTLLEARDANSGDPRTLAASQSSAPTQKCGRPLGSKDSHPRKRKTTAQGPEEPTVNPTIAYSFYPTHEEILDYGSVLEETNPPRENPFAVATEIMLSDDIESRSVDECRRRADWSNWKQAIQVELDSLAKRKVFGPVVPTPLHVKPVGYKWVFVRKRNEKNEIVRYKAHLVAQGFSQRPEIDYDETYSPVIDVITFRYLISLVVSEKLDMQLMDVVTAYLYGDLDTEIYMKSGICEHELCPCVFIKKSHSGFAIVAVYVDDINLIRTPEELARTASHLKSEFEMKDLGKTRYCLGLEIEHCSDGILVHQSNYTQKVLRRFNEDKAKSSSTPMVVRTLDAKRDPFRLNEDDEKILEPEVPYLSTIGALLYLAQCIRPDISFAVNLLARYSNAPTRRHWTGVKDIFRYLKGTTDLGLFYPYESSSDAAPYAHRVDSRLVGYANAGYLSDPHKARSQTGYVFTVGGTAISWRSTKQTLVATSSNHAEILALHEATRECFWLRAVMGHIRSSCDLHPAVNALTTIFEDNAACIEQLKKGYIKGDNTKHITPKFFFTHQQQEHQKIEVTQIRSQDNLADLFTKSLPKATFQKLVHGIGMRKLSKL
ncbi:hypothetical protein ACFX2K_017216 [Malus domestica]